MSNFKIGKSSISHKVLCIVMAFSLCLMMLPSALFKTQANASEAQDENRVKAADLFKFSYAENSNSANKTTLTQADLLDVLNNRPIDITASMAQSAAETELKVQLDKANLFLEPDEALIPKEGAKYTDPSVESLALKDAATNNLNGHIYFAKDVQTKNFDVTTSNVAENLSGAIDVAINYAQWDATYEVYFSTSSVAVPLSTEWTTVDATTAIIKYRFSSTGNVANGKPTYNLETSIQVKNNTKNPTTFIANIEKTTTESANNEENNEQNENRIFKRTYVQHYSDNPNPPNHFDVYLSDILVDDEIIDEIEITGCSVFDLEGIFEEDVTYDNANKKFILNAISTFSGNIYCYLKIWYKISGIEYYQDIVCDFKTSENVYLKDECYHNVAYLDGYVNVPYNEFFKITGELAITYADIVMSTTYEYYLGYDNGNQVVKLGLEHGTCEGLFVKLEVDCKIDGIDYTGESVFINLPRVVKEIDFSYENYLKEQLDDGKLKFKTYADNNSDVYDNLKSIVVTTTDFERDVYAKIEDNTELLTSYNFYEHTVGWTISCTIPADKIHFSESYLGDIPDGYCKIKSDRLSFSIDIKDPTVIAPSSFDTKVHTFDNQTQANYLDWCKSEDPTKIKIQSNSDDKFYCYGTSSTSDFTTSFSPFNASQLSVKEKVIGNIYIKSSTDNNALQLLKEYKINYDKDVPRYDGYNIIDVPGSDIRSTIGNFVENWDVEELVTHLFWFSDGSTRVKLNISDMLSGVDKNNCSITLDKNVAEPTWDSIGYDTSGAYYYYDITSKNNYDIEDWAIKVSDIAGNEKQYDVYDESYEKSKEIVSNVPNPESASLIWQTKNSSGNWEDSSDPSQWAPQNMTNKDVRLRLKVVAEYFEYTVNDKTYGSKTLFTKTTTANDNQEYKYNNFKRDSQSSNTWYLDIECSSALNTFTDCTIVKSAYVKDILERVPTTQESIETKTWNFSIDKLGPELLEDQCSLTFASTPSTGSGYYNTIVTANIVVKEHYEMNSTVNNLHFVFYHDNQAVGADLMPVQSLWIKDQNVIGDVWTKTITFCDTSKSQEGQNAYQGNWKFDFYGTDSVSNPLFRTEANNSRTEFAEATTAWKSTDWQKSVGHDGIITQDWTSPVVVSWWDANQPKASRSASTVPASPDGLDYFNEGQMLRSVKATEKYSWDSLLIEVNKEGTWSEGSYSFNDWSGTGESIDYLSSIDCSDNTRHQFNITGKDKAGNSVVNDKGSEDYVSEQFVLDSKHPTVEIKWDRTLRYDRYFNMAGSEVVTASIIVTEHNFWGNFINVSYKYTDNARTGTSTIPVDTTHANWTQISGNTDMYRLDVSLSNEGDYEFVVDGEDIATNDLVWTGEKNITYVTIDKTAPTGSIVFDNNNAVNGKYFTGPRNATITIDERNFFDGSHDPEITTEPQVITGHDGSRGYFNQSGWSHNNNDTIHTMTVNFPVEGTYVITVEGVDLANKALNPLSSGEFVVDWTQPNINISGVSDHQAYGDAISPVVTINDANMSPQTNCQVNNLGITKGNPFQTSPAASDAQYTYSYPNPERIPDNDGVYRINVNAYDMAGNASTQTLAWSVNRFGSTYVIDAETEKMMDGYVNNERLVDVKVTEINPSNIESKHVEMTKGSFTNTLTEGQDYTASVSGGGDSWVQCEYVIAKNFFKEDSRYSINYYSKDAAGNENDNTQDNRNQQRNAKVNVQFMLDNAKPTCFYNNLGENLINKPDHDASVVFEDNSKEFEFAKVTIDGKETYLQGDKLKKDNDYEIGFTLNDSATPHEITVESTDKAGNKMETSHKSVVVSTNPFVLWFYNTPLFIGTLVVIASIAGGLIWWFVKRSNNENNKQAGKK